MAEPRTISQNPIDAVVASQPELGPTPPDGGYGWIVLLSALVFQITVPTLVVSYSVILLYLNYQDEYDSASSFRLWDSSIGLVPVLFIVIKMLMEPWSRTLVSLFNMPRVMALTGVCLVGAGVMLSSFSMSSEDNGIIINVFAGIFAGMGVALTDQQNEVLLGHYFRKKLDMVRGIYRIGPSIGYSIMPFLMAALCLRFGAGSATLVFGAIIIQNCLFLAAYSRPIYVTVPVQRNYKMLNDAEEDDDEDIFTNMQEAVGDENGTVTVAVNNQNEDADESVIATFNTQNTTREVVSTSYTAHERAAQLRQHRTNENRFSSDFTNANENRLSVERNGRLVDPVTLVSLDRIERYGGDPQSLYRETTLVNDAPNSLFSFDNPNVTAGTARRNRQHKRSFVSVMQMFLTLEFYLHTVLQSCSTLSLFIFGFLFTPYVSEKEPNMGVFKVATLVGVNYVGALCLNVVSVFVPRTMNKRRGLSIFFCMMGALGFYGISASVNRSWLVVWGMVGSYASTALHILQPSIYDEMNEFDAMSTSIASNFITVVILLLSVFVYSFEYATCFELAALVQLLTASILFSTVITKTYIRR